MVVKMSFKNITVMYKITPRITHTFKQNPTITHTQNSSNAQ